MPKMGDAMEEGTIVQFLKSIGDSVGPDDAIFEIETDKSNVEVPAGVAGVVHAIHYAAGTTVPVGTPIVVIGQGAPPAGASAPATATAEPKKTESAVETAPSTTPAAPVQSVAVEFVAGRPLGDTYAGAFPENLGGSASVLGEPIDTPPGASDVSVGRVKASPLARAMAAASGVNLSSIAGNGPVKAADVAAALKSPVTASVAPAGIDATEVQPYNGMRKTIARRLAESKQTIPHFYVTIEVDMEALLSLREQFNALGAGKASVNDCLVKAVAIALVKNPNVNSKFDDNKRIVSKSAHIGFGVALDDGLIVPVVRNCESKSLRQIASETKPLIEKARAGKLQPSEYTGGTFTISNLGAVAEVENFAAIVNPGEGAILAISATRSVPAVVDGQIAIRRRMKMTLSADHRVVDGADGAAFLGELKRILENPLEILL